MVKETSFSLAVLAAAFVSKVAVYGLVSSWAKFQHVLKQDLNVTLASASLIGTIQQTAFFSSGAVGTILFNKWGSEKIFVMSGLLCFIGLFTSIYASKVWHLIITYGILVGTGSGICFMICSSIVSYHFETHRTIANAVAATGSGVGSLIMPLLLDYLFRHHNWQQVILLLLPMTHILMLSAILMHTPTGFFKAKKCTFANTQENVTQNDQAALSKASISSRMSICQKLRRMWRRHAFLPQVLKDKAYLLFLLSVSLTMGGSYMVINLLEEYARDMGVSGELNSKLLAIIGITQTITRPSIIVVDLLLLKYSVNKMPIFYITVSASAVYGIAATILGSLKADDVSYTVCTVIFGLAFGMYQGNLVNMLVILFGFENLPTLLGILELAAGLVIVPATYIGSVLKDTGNFPTSFHLAGTMMIVSVIIQFPVVYFIKRTPPPELEVMKTDILSRIRILESPPEKQYQTIHSISSLPQFFGDDFDLETLVIPPENKDVVLKIPKSASATLMQNQIKEFTKQYHDKNTRLERENGFVRSSNIESPSRQNVHGDEHTTELELISHLMEVVKKKKKQTPTIMGVFSLESAGSMTDELKETSDLDTESFKTTYSSFPETSTSRGSPMGTSTSRENPGNLSSVNQLGSFAVKRISPNDSPSSNT